MNVVILSAPGRDEDLRDQFHSHLQPLAAAAGLAVWHDGMICAGEDRLQTAVGRAQRADIVVILVTADFLALQQTNDDLALVTACLFRSNVWLFPVLTRHCLHHVAPFFRRGVMSFNGKPVAACDDRDEAWTHIVAQIERLLHERPLMACSPGYKPPREIHVRRPRKLGMHEAHLDDAVDVLRSRADRSAFTLLQSVTLFGSAHTLALWAETIAKTSCDNFDAKIAWNTLAELSLVERPASSPQFVVADSRIHPLASSGMADAASLVIIHWLENSDARVIRSFHEILSHALFVLLESVDPRNSARLVKALFKHDDVNRLCDSFDTLYVDLDQPSRAAAQQFFRHVARKHRLLRKGDMDAILKDLAQTHCPQLSHLLTCATGAQ